ncbi:MAG: YfhO family protein [Thermanaerothrix sp.]|nr:YfhO family protein [Thermanaerothrix sp.]
MADPLSSLWYPPAWLSVLFPSALSFNLTFVFHLFFLGAGMYRWLRLEGYNRRAALLGSWALMLFPKIIAHWGAGHYTLIYAFSWTPWVLVAEKLRQNYAKQAWQAFFFPGVVLGLGWLADLRWGMVLAGLWLGYAISGERNYLPRIEVHRFITYAIQFIWGFMVAAPLLLPFLEWLPLTTRNELKPSEALAYSLPPYSLIGLLFPGFGRAHEWVTYLGMVPICMLVLVIAVPTLRCSLKGWLILGGLAILAALGAYLPGMDILMSLPGVSLLRVPARFWFVVGFVVALSTAAGVNWLMTSPRVLRPDIILWLSGLLGFIVFLTLGWRYLLGEVPLLLLFGIILLAIIVLIVALWERQRLRRDVGWGIFALLLLIDLGVVSRTWIAFYTEDDVWGEASNLVAFLRQDKGIFRVYSPSFSLPQYIATRSGLELADGVHPLQLKSYVEYMSMATGVPQKGYSVTLPPFLNGAPAVDNRFYSPHADWLGWWNVKYVVSAFPLQEDDLELITKIDGQYIYLNRDAFPRAWIQFDLDWPPRVEGEAHILSRTPNEWNIMAQGPGWLILAEVVYPGWEAFLDGQPRKMQSLLGLFRAIEVPMGQHVITFKFRPRIMMLGIGLAVFAWGVVFMAPVMEKIYKSRSGIRKPRNDEQ